MFQYAVFKVHVRRRGCGAQRRHGAMNPGRTHRCCLPPLGLSGLEPPTSRLSGVRSNRLSYKPPCPGTHLSSHAVPGIVFSAARGLTAVFGMGTGVPHARIGTRCP